VFFNINDELIRINAIKGSDTVKKGVFPICDGKRNKKLRANCQFQRFEI